jgi:hypothetical protein
MKKKAFALLLILVFVSSSSSLSAETITEEPELQWSKNYEGINGNNVIQTFDGGYLIVGTTATQNTVLYLMKADSLGELQWEKKYGMEFGVGVSVDAITQTADEGFALCHLGGFFSGNRDDGWFLKIDSQGNVELNKTMTVEAGYASFFSIIQTSDRGFVLTCRGLFWNMSVFGDIIKMDEYGKTIWEKIYSLASVDSIVQTDDGGFTLSGTWNSDAWFAKTNSQGEITLTKTYGYGDFRSVSQTSDGGYMLTGFTGLGLDWIQKIDSDGNVVWEHKERNSGMGSVKQASDGGYSVVGLIAESSGFIRRPYFGKIDTDGNFLFNVTYDTTDVFSIVPNEDYSFTLAHTSGGVRLEKFSFPSSKVPPSTSVQLTAAPVNQTENSTTLVIALTSGGAIALAATGLLAYHKKHKH